MTACQSRVLKALLSSVVTEYDSKSPSIEIQSSGYRAQDIQFLANPKSPRLTIAEYINALMTVRKCVHKWGAKELDFEIRLDADATTSRSNFHRRTGNSFGIQFTDQINLSRVIASSLPIDCQAPGRILGGMGLTVRPSYPSENNSSEFLLHITAVRTGFQIARPSTDAMSSSQYSRANACSGCSICPNVRYEPNLGPVSGSASVSVVLLLNQRSESGALGRRFYVERRDLQETPYTILGRGIGGPSSTVHPYIRRCNHPSPMDVSSWEGHPNMPKSLIEFFSTATY